MWMGTDRSKVHDHTSRKVYFNRNWVKSRMKQLSSRGGGILVCDNMMQDIFNSSTVNFSPLISSLYVFTLIFLHYAHDER